MVSRRRAAATGGSAVLLALALAGPAFAAFPSTNGRIVFVSYRNNGLPTLYTVDPTAPTTSVAALTTAGDDMDPAVSPDGTTVVFSRTANATPGIYTVPLAAVNEESAVHLVVADPTAIEPSWSPDGHTLIYVSTVSGIRTLETIDTTAASPTPTVLFTDTANDDYPIFDPADPTKIVFVRSTSPGVSQVSLYSTTTHLVTNLSNVAANDSTPDFSSDGQWIVFQSDRSGTSQLWSMSVTGGSQHALFSTPTGVADTDPAFSPDGQFVTWVRPMTSQSKEIETLSTALTYTAAGPTVAPAATVTDDSLSAATDIEPVWASVPEVGTNLPEVGAPALLAVAGLASFGAVAAFRRRRSA